MCASGGCRKRGKRKGKRRGKRREKDGKKVLTRMGKADIISFAVADAASPGRGRQADGAGGAGRKK